MSEQIPNMDYSADEVIKGFKEKFKWTKADEVQAVVKPKKIGLRLLLSLLATIIAGGVVYYNMLPALNFKDSQMYIFIITLIVIFMLAFSFACRANKLIERKEYVKSKTKIPVVIVAILVLIMIIGSVCGATIFRAGSYSKLMPVTNSEFSEDFKTISYDSVPRIDQDRALTLADQQLGSLAD